MKEGLEFIGFMTIGTFVSLGVVFIFYLNISVEKIIIQEGAPILIEGEVYKCNKQVLKGVK